MRTLDDVKVRLRLELLHWRNRQDQYPHNDYYLYYLPSTAEHDGGFGFLADSPANTEVRLAMAERLDKQATVAEMYDRLLPILQTLPILEVTP